MRSYITLFFLLLYLPSCQTPKEQVDFSLVVNRLESILPIHRDIGIYKRGDDLFFAIHLGSSSYLSKIVFDNNKKRYLLAENIKGNQAHLFRNNSDTCDIQREVEKKINSIIDIYKSSNILCSTCDNPTNIIECEFWLKNDMKGYLLKDSAFIKNLNQDDILFLKYPWIFVKHKMGNE